MNEQGKELIFTSRKRKFEPEQITGVRMVVLSGHPAIALYYAGNVIQGLAYSFISNKTLA